MTDLPPARDPAPSAPDPARRRLALGLAWGAVAGVALLLGFILVSGTILAFWSVPWLVSLLFLVGLTGVAGALFRLAAHSRRGDQVLAGFGLCHGVLGVLLLAGWGWRQFIHGLSLGDYAGYALLLTITVGGTALGGRQGRGGLLVATGYAMVSALLVVGLGWKYVVAFRGVSWGTFVGELGILLLGVGLFLHWFREPGAEEA